MNRRRILFVALALAAVGSMAWLLLREPAELLHQGRPISKWMNIYARTFDGSPGQLSAHEAATIIDETGTNAIPALLRMLRAKDSKWNVTLAALAAKFPIIHFEFHRDYVKHQTAAAVFSALGSKAGNAVPALIEIYNQNISFSSRATAVEALGSIGPAAQSAVPVLLRELPTNQQPVRVATIHALGLIHEPANLILPALTNALHDPDVQVRGEAIQALQYFKANAAFVVPELISALQDPYVVNRATAALILHELDPAAATNALKTLDPQTADLVHRIHNQIPIKPN